MLKSGQKNNYQEFLKRKRQFAEKIKQGKKFKDTDGDGLSDYEEKKIYGTDPKNPDTDRDGMPDGDEVKRGRNPLGPGKLKDLFIPHAGNNYSPHALKPERLLFHALSLVAMKSIVVVFILLYPLSAWLSPDLVLAEVKKIIELTNNLRQTVSLPALLENRQLKQAAWQKAEDMALNQYFAHVSPVGLGLRNWLEKSGYKYAVAGENLAVGFARAEDVVTAWRNSPAHYQNIIDGDFKEIGVAVADGRFKQVDAVFIAQYFAAPALVQTEPWVKETAKNQAAAVGPSLAGLAKPAPEAEVRGAEIAKTTAEPAAPAAVDQTAPAAEKTAENEIIINQQTATLSIKSDQFNEERAVQIKTTLPAGTVSAEIIINGRKINLNKEPGQANQWHGALLVGQTEEKNILNPLIPASLAVKNSAGAVALGRIDWDEVKMIKATPLEHYRLFRNYPAAAMAPIMNLSGSYFKLILIIAVMAVLLNIFIEIKKQRPRIIFYSFVFLGWLVAMIIF